MRATLLLVFRRDYPTRALELPGVWKKAIEVENDADKMSGRILLDGHRYPGVISRAGQ